MWGLKRIWSLIYVEGVRWGGGVVLRGGGKRREGCWLTSRWKVNPLMYDFPSRDPAPFCFQCACVRKGGQVSGVCVRVCMGYAHQVRFASWMESLPLVFVWMIPSRTDGIRSHDMTEKKQKTIKAPLMARSWWNCKTSSKKIYLIKQFSIKHLDADINKVATVGGAKAPSLLDVFYTTSFNYIYCCFYWWY